MEFEKKNWGLKLNFERFWGNFVNLSLSEAILEKLGHNIIKI